MENELKPSEQITGEEKRKSSGVLILIVLLLILAVAGGAGYYFLGGNSVTADNKTKKEKDKEVKESTAIKDLESKGYKLLDESTFSFLAYDDLASVGQPKSMEKYTKYNIPEEVKDIISFNKSTLTIDVSKKDSFDNKSIDSISNVKYFTVNYEADNAVYIDVIAFTGDNKIYRFFDNGHDDAVKFELISENGEYDDVYIVDQLSDECISGPTHLLYLKGKDNYKFIGLDEEDYTIPANVIENYKYFVYPVSILEDIIYIEDTELKETFKYGAYFVDSIRLDYILTSSNKLISIKDKAVLAYNIKALMYKESEASCSTLDAYDFVAVDGNDQVIELGDRINIFK